MGSVAPDFRLRQEYGSVKAALLYCVDMNMNKTQAAKFLGIDRRVLRERANRLRVDFPCGYATRDLTLPNEINRKRLIEANHNGTMGKRRKHG
jgi:hypothetical protein